MDFQNKTDPPQSSNSPPSNPRQGRGSPPSSQENFNSSNYANPVRASGAMGTTHNRQLGGAPGEKQMLPPMQGGSSSPPPDVHRQGLMNNNQPQGRPGNNDRMPIDGNGPVMNNEMIQNSYYDNNQRTPEQPNKGMYNDYRRGSGGGQSGGHL